MAMGTVARPSDPCLDVAMIPTLSSRGRRGTPGAAYWRLHPPTPWKTTQALLEQESVAQPHQQPQPVNGEQSLPASVEAVPEAARPVQISEAIAAEPHRQHSPHGQPEPIGRTLLMLFLWAVLLLIDAAMALRELAAQLAPHGTEKAPRSRRNRRTQGALPGDWPAPLAGLP
jgi:hypothetical protein